MAAPTPTQSSTSPVPDATPTAAYATFMQHVLGEMLHELRAVRKELQDIRRHQQADTRKRKRSGPTPPCTLCRLSRIPCDAGPDDACSRCIRKQVECFDDSSDPPRVRHPREEDAQDESEPDEQPVVWQVQHNGAYPPTPVKRERVTKACADCHARKRKCGPNCPARTRPSPNKTTPARTREPCADCRARKRRCIHNPDGTLTPGKTPEDEVDAVGEEVPEEQPEVQPSSSHTSHSRSPPPNRWHYPPGPPPPPHPHWSYEQRPPYPPHHPPPFVHDRPPYPHPHPHPHPHAPPPHPHGLHPHPHPHARLPPAPDMRHPSGCKDCHARGVPCTCTSDPNHPHAQQPPTSTSKPATPGPPAPPAGRKGRACLACRKLKMRCVAPNEDGGPDERCQRCDRAGLECVYVDRKRRGPGGVFPPGVGEASPDDAARKKMKREVSPGASGSYPQPGVLQVEMQMQRVGEDAARALEESFADEDVQ